ncbi:hypothetical protein ROLI_015100 [Roseobacter fucihabitans]|uniref:Uncharacterized protein n=1 Tax=Roseobacter fucihabitans TaxID=1537242 RepID=A0ABZ2BTB1_9RHOB|nr:hypothetical protein [Roseobacter litoralis]
MEFHVVGHQSYKLHAQRKSYAAGLTCYPSERGIRVSVAFHHTIFRSYTTQIRYVIS